MTRTAAALAILLSILGVFVFAAPSSAQKYPDRTVTLIVPYPAGGPTDETARIIANSLTKQLGQSFIVENVTGGSTIVATNKVAKATPDGYTLLVHNLQITANIALFKDMPFNTEKDITSVGLINKNPLVIVGRPGLAPKSLKDLIALMKKENLKEALPGFGTTGHLTSALFQREAGVKLDQIPYRGAAPAMTDLLGDHVDLFIGTPQSVVAYVKAGKLKAYGITSKEKSPLLPDAESLVDLLGPKFEIVYWQGLFAPSGTPPAVIKTLNTALQVAASDPDIIKKWAAEGVTPFPKDQRSTAAAEAFFKSEAARWGGIIRDNNIHVTQ
jgi:tripartite-type tricarboxylate transporter receptor subunit TctC